MTTNLPLHQLSTITTGQPFKYTAGEPKTDLWLRPPLGKRVGPGSQRVRGSRASVPFRSHLARLPSRHRHAPRVQISKALPVLVSLLSSPLFLLCSPAALLLPRHARAQRTPPNPIPLVLVSFSSPDSVSRRRMEEEPRLLAARAGT